MSKHKFKVGDTVHCNELDDKEWIIILLREDDGCTVACNTSSRGWEIHYRDLELPDKYIGYSGWNTTIDELTFIRSANPIWLNNTK